MVVSKGEHMNTHEQATQEVRDAFAALCKGRVEAAVLAEREACAKVCDWYVDYSSNPMNFAENCAQEIRARGNT